jgi:hypothetical protein
MLDENEYRRSVENICGHCCQDVKASMADLLTKIENHLFWLKQSGANSDFVCELYNEVVQAIERVKI